MTEPTIEQLKQMIQFLKNDIEEDRREISIQKGIRYTYINFKIGLQIKRSLQQIRHYEDKIVKYEHDPFT